MSKPFILIEDGKVINIALYDSLEHAERETLDTTTVIEVVDGMQVPAIGDLWDGQQFTPAPVIEELPIEEPVNDQSQN